jgi:glycosyltransferase involved in cell wall biosynthesis
MAADPPSHVVMLVANDVRTDTRVRKTALSASRAGLRVTVVGYSPDGVRHEACMGPCRLIRVPVPWRAKAATQRRHAWLDRTPPTRFARRAWRAGWSRTRLAVDWRRVLPDIGDYAAAYAPVIAELAPDLLHAHDVHMVGIAHDAAARAQAAGRWLPWVYDAHEYVPGLSCYGPRTPRVIAGYADLELQYIRSADRVITVSPPIAAELSRRFDLDRPPALVLNTPARSGRRSGRSVRSVAGVADDAPLLVYSGGVTHARGVQTAISALPQLPDTHLAVIAVPHTRTGPIDRMRDLAGSLGVVQRVHFLDPVPADELIGFLESATIGLIPLLRFGSHEMALTNKLFEYLHAGLPMVVSDCRSQSEFVREHELGRVHRAGDPSDLADAVRAVLAERDAYVQRRRTDLVERYSWERQEEVLWAVYRELLGPAAVPDPPSAGSQPFKQVVEESCQ